MSASRNSLQAVLDRQVAATPSAPADVPAAKPAPEPTGEKFYRPSRAGRKLIAGHFDPRTAKHLKILAAEEGTTVQALLEEALNLLFVKKGKGAIKS